MMQNLAREFHAFHYVGGNRITLSARSSSPPQEMTMSAFVRYLPAAAELLPWLLNLTMWLVARSLNVPEPLVHATGLFVFVRVQAFENSFLKALCPKRLMRRVLTLRRQGAVITQPNQGEPT
jgi:hypothetical protein